jgi:endonuclease YncB( thermonuclease family)
MARRIDCPEDGQEWGDIATRGLIKLIGGKSVRLEAHGTDSHGRTLGTLFVYLQHKGEWQNVNERMVTLGHAWVSAHDVSAYQALLPEGGGL